VKLSGVARNSASYLLRDAIGGDVVQRVDSGDGDVTLYHTV